MITFPAMHWSSAGFVPVSLLDHTLLYWKCDETGGTPGNILDAHTNGEDLTVINNPGSAAGIINTSRSFTAASSMTAHRASDAVISPGNTSFTWVINCYLASKTTHMVLLNKGGLAVELQEYYLLYNFDTDRFSWTVADGTHNTDDTSITDNIFGSPPLDEWIQICAIFNAATKQRKLVINGDKITSSSSALWPGHNNSDDMYLGSLVNTLFFWDGRIDEVGLFDKALSDAECLALWDGGARLPYPFS